MPFFEPPPQQPESERPAWRSKPWWGPPANAIGEVVPLNVIVGRSEQAAIAGASATVYGEGLSISVVARLRSDHMPEEPLHPLHPLNRRSQQAELPDELLRFGLEFADGSRVTSLDIRRPPSKDHDEPPPAPVMRPRGGRGGEGMWQFALWVWPLPPPGPLALVCEWPRYGIAESRVEVDADPIRAAAARVTTLWDDSGAESAPVAGGSSGQYTVMSTRTASAAGPSRSPVTERVISHATELAAEMGHGVVGTEHLLLALVEEPDGGAANALREAAVLDELRAQLRRMFGRL